MIEIRNLIGISIEQMTEAFNDAFSDYEIPAKYTPEYLGSLVARRGYRPDLAVGAFDGGRLVGFVFNCLDGDAAYNSGTGVAISHRRMGIARQLMQRSIETLPAKRYILEVIETNERAAALYRDLGFDEARRVQCWLFDATERRRFPELANADLDEIASWGEMTPRWQNSVASIRRARESYVTLGNADAALVFFPWTGDVPLLAVRPEKRRQGLGRALVEAAAARADRTLRIMNIDDAATGVAAFLESIGARRFVRQIEMVRNL